MNIEREDMLNSNKHKSLKMVKATIVSIEDLAKIYNVDGSVKDDKIKIPARVFEIAIEQDIEEERKNDYVI